jgi:DNA-nicking Smr family endonuclease
MKRKKEHNFKKYFTGARTLSSLRCRAPDDAVRRAALHAVQSTPKASAYNFILHLKQYNMKHSHYQRPPRTVQGTAGDILAFLDKYGTRNKDTVAAKEVKPAKKLIEKGKGGVPRMTLDLHGQTGEQASRRMRLTFESCSGHGVKELLIIHGQGHHSNLQEGPVLKKLVRDMLDNELNLRVNEYRSASPREGGDGATVVFLR